jgi:hypothetical protein
MLPTLSANEQIKFNADVAAKNRANSGKDDADGTSADKTALVDAKSRGMTYDEAKIAFGDRLSITYINSLYSDLKSTGNNEDALKDIAYSQYLNADGTLKEGYVATVDPKNGRPVVTKAPSTGGIGAYLSGIWNAVIGN